MPGGEEVAGVEGDTDPAALRDAVPDLGELRELGAQGRALAGHVLEEDADLEARRLREPIVEALGYANHGPCDATPEVRARVHDESVDPDRLGPP